MALSEFRQATHSIDHVPDLPFSLHQEGRPELTQLPRIVIRWSYCHRGIDIQVTVIYRYRVDVMDVGQQIGNIIVELEIHGKRVPHVDRFAQAASWDKSGKCLDDANCLAVEFGIHRTHNLYFPHLACSIHDELYNDLTLNILFFGYGWLGYIIPDIGHQGSLSTREHRHLLDRHEHLIILTR